MTYMLHALHYPKTGELRLYVKGIPIEAWITPGTPHGSVRGTDWSLYVRSGERSTAEKSPTRLLIESRLKAWLFQRCGRPLYTLRFRDLAKIADGEIG